MSPSRVVINWIGIGYLLVCPWSEQRGRIFPGTVNHTSVKSQIAAADKQASIWACFFLICLQLFYSSQILVLFLVSVPLKNRNNSKSNNSTHIIFPLTMLRKATAWTMMLFSSASFRSTQLQPPYQGRCSGPSAGCCSRPLQNIVYFCCSAPACFSFPGQ